MNGGRTDCDGDDDDDDDDDGDGGNGSCLVKDTDDDCMFSSW